MMRNILFGLALAFALQPHSLSADDGDADPNLISLGVGAFDVIQGSDLAADFRLEYRHGDGLWIFKPWAGVEATSDGAIYGLVGVLSDFHFGPLVVTPSFGAGAYHDGNGLDLGSVWEFRSQLEIAYEFDDRSRLGVAISHISNAGITDRNPGTEIATLYYSTPIGSLFSSKPYPPDRSQ